MTITIGELLQKEFPPQREIFGPWIQEGNLVLFYAPRGIGKTFFALWLAHAIATGSKFLKWQGPREYRVALFDGEMGQRALKGRLAEIVRQLGGDIRGNALSITSFEDFPDGMPNLSTPIGQRAYEKAMQGYSVAIIDNLLSCSGPLDGRDDEVRQWKRVQDWAIKQRSAGKTIIFIHHSGKSGQQLGTSVRENIMDTIVSLRKPTEEELINGFEADFTFEKTRHFYGEDARPLCIKFETDEAGSRWSWTTREQKRQDWVHSLRTSGLSENEILKETGLSRYQLRKIIQATETKWNGEEDYGQENF